MIDHTLSLLYLLPIFLGDFRLPQFPICFLFKSFNILVKFSIQLCSFFRSQIRSFVRHVVSEVALNWKLVKDSSWSQGLRSIRTISQLSLEENSQRGPHYIIPSSNDISRLITSHIFFSNSIINLKRSSPGAPWVRKIGYLCI